VSTCNYLNTVAPFTPAGEPGRLTRTQRDEIRPPAGPIALAWQAWLREHKPPTLVVWGRNDPSFIAAGREAFRRDLPDAEIHLLDAGHFALDEKNDEIASLILAFLAKHSI